MHENKTFKMLMSCHGLFKFTYSRPIDILFINVFSYIIIIEVDLNSLPQSHSWHFLLYEALTTVNVLQLLGASSHLLPHS